MDFDDMNKRLGDASQKESRVNQLASELFKRGLAMTMDSAKQLASSMVETEMRVQKRFQDRMHPMSAPASSSSASAPSASAAPVRAPSYSEVARDAVAKRTFMREDPIIQPKPREETPRPLPRTEILGLDAKKSLKELQDDYERAHGAVPAAALKENIDALREKAQRPAPVAIQTSFDTPGNGAATPKMVDLSEDDFIEIRPEHFPEERAAAQPSVVMDASPAEAPVPSSPVPDLEVVSLAPDVASVLPPSAPEEPVLAAEPAATATSEAPDAADDDGFLLVGDTPDHGAEPGDEPLHAQEETEEQPEAPVAPAEPPAKPKRDMAKEHGIDINSIFKFGK